MQEKFKNKRQSGFTLVELMVSVSIMVLLLSVFTANFNGLSRSRNLKLAENNFVSDLHEMQSLSIASKNASVGHPASSYQALLSTASQASSAQYSLASSDNSQPSISYSISSVNLPGNIYIKNLNVLKPDGTNIPVTGLTLYFTVPYGRVLMTYSGSSSEIKEADDIATITLSTTDNTLSTSVTINGISGNITSQ